jgi:hypothetical protein
MVAAAAAAGMRRSTLFEWRANDAEFGEVCTTACELVADLAEHELLRRGMRDGDTLALLAWLRARRPHLYRRGTWVDAALTVQHQQVGDDGDVNPTVQFYLPPNHRDEPERLDEEPPLIEADTSQWKAAAAALRADPMGAVVEVDL